MIHKDCFAYGETPGGKPSCAALTKIDCAGCKFYKTKEKFYDDRDKANRRLRRIGMWEVRQFKSK